jgi:predicted RNase H-like HicB family nuclease
MATAHYTVILEREADGGFHAFVPALRGCHSQGDTLEETVESVREAIGLYLDSLAAHGESAPIEDLYVRPVEVAA